MNNLHYSCPKNGVKYTSSQNFTTTLCRSSQRRLYLSLVTVMQIFFSLCFMNKILEK